MNRLRFCLLGAANGLLFGSAVEVLRRVYTPYYLESHTQRIVSAIPAGMHPPYTFTCIGDEASVIVSGIPVLSSLIFAAVALLIHVFWGWRIRSTFLFWQIVDVVSMTLAVILHDRLSPVCHHTYLLPLVWRWILCLPIVAGINLAYSFLIATSAAYYGRKKDAWLR